MKLIIDVTENHLKTLQKMNECGLGYYHRAILNGTPLPKGHGDLIDKDKLICKLKNSYLDTFGMERVMSILSKSPTIIEADKENK